MSRDWYNDVLEFHKAMCPEQIGTKPGIPSSEVVLLRADLMQEELSETHDAMAADDLVEIADGLADLIYVALGTAIAFGIDLRPVWDEVQRSNLAKLGGERREDGKRMKPTGWTPPDIKGVLDRQAAQQEETAR